MEGRRASTEGVTADAMFVLDVLEEDEEGDTTLACRADGENTALGRNEVRVLRARALPDRVLASSLSSPAWFLLVGGSCSMKEAGGGR
jgi:hypothetical protein